MDMPQNKPLSVRLPSQTKWTGNSTSEDPMSPYGRIMQDMGVYIVVVMGLGEPINFPVFLAGIEAELLPRFPRFRCIQEMDAPKHGIPRWVETKVHVDDHIIVPRLGPAVLASDPEKAVEDYLASLSMLPMDSTNDLSRLPAMPPPPKRTGAIYEQLRPPLSDGNLAFLSWIWSYFMVAWNTLVDLTLLLATILFLRDPYTLFKRTNGSEPYRKRFVHRSISLDDVKFLKTTMNCTVNDVLVGVTSAALSRYYFRNSGDTNTKRSISLRSIIPVNTRKVSNRKTFVTKVETGNRLGHLICPFRIALYDEPLEYIREAKRVMHRKKRSLEVIFSHLFVEFLVKYLGVKIGSFIWGLFLTRTTVILSNIVGPAEKITLCGHPIAFIATSIYGNPQALTVHYLNYDSIIKIILAVDDAQFSDCHLLLNDFTESIKLMKDAASLMYLTTLRMPPA
ncbi:unnamed protein product [Alopecurus aequalis]